MENLLYRYVNINYAPPVDEFDNPIGEGRVAIHLREYSIIKETPCGCWIDMGCGEKRFVLNNSRKRFACRTREQALESFKARKQSEARIYAARLRNVHKAIRLAENHDVNQDE